MELSSIYEPVYEDLVRADALVGSVCKVDSPHLQELLEYSLKSTGKRIRPLLTLLAAKFYDYNTERVVPMAAAAEIMHTATLVHDDSIDNSVVRRGRPTVNKLWGDEKAILLGDYLFAEAGTLTASTGNLRAIALFARTLKVISSGELSQAFNVFKLNRDREQYYRRIGQKTASLFVMSAESGAALSNAPEEAIQVLVDYSYNLGIAFQVVDDILDFIGTEEELGKPVGSDLTQGTLTLPAIMLLEQYPADNPVARLFAAGEGQEDIARALDMVRNSDIIPECYRVAGDFCTKACRDLDRLPDVPGRHSLLDLAGYIVRRKK